jgi:hypothetical protein
MTSATPISVGEAATRLGFGRGEAGSRCLRRAIARAIAAGAPSPFLSKSLVTLSGIALCLPQLRPDPAFDRQVFGSAGQCRSSLAKSRA